MVQDPKGRIQINIFTGPGWLSVEKVPLASHSSQVLPSKICMNVFIELG